MQDYYLFFVKVNLRDLIFNLNLHSLTSSLLLFQCLICLLCLVLEIKKRHLLDCNFSLVVTCANSKSEIFASETQPRQIPRRVHLAYKDYDM